MLITCWSSKGGSGTTVVSAALAALLAGEAGTARLVDLGGDLPAALGLPEPDVGLTGWAVPPFDENVAAEIPGLAARRARRELAGLEVDAGGGVRLLPRGRGGLPDGIGAALAGALAGPEPVVVDAGVVGEGAGAGPAVDLAASATVSLLVIRPCFLALRRAVAAPLRAGAVVLVDEPQRVLGRSDVESALGIPVLACVPWEAAVARRVDAGLLGSALPSAVTRPLRRALAASGSPPAPSATRRRPPGAARPRPADRGAGGATRLSVGSRGEAGTLRAVDGGTDGGARPAASRLDGGGQSSAGRPVGTGTRRPVDPGAGEGARSPVLGAEEAGRMGPVDHGAGGAVRPPLGWPDRSA